MSKEEIKKEQKPVSKAALWQREYRKRLKKERPEEYERSLEANRIRQNARYAKDPTNIKASQKRYRENPEISEHLSKKAADWNAKHPLKLSFNKGHSDFLTFVKGGRAVQRAIEDNSEIEASYKQDLLDMQIVIDDYIEAVESCNDDWTPMITPSALPNEMSPNIRKSFVASRNGAFRWAAPMTREQFDSEKSVIFRQKFHDEYLQRLYKDRELLNKRIKELDAK